MLFAIFGIWRGERLKRVLYAQRFAPRTSKRNAFGFQALSRLAKQQNR